MPVFQSLSSFIPAERRDGSRAQRRDQEMRDATGSEDEHLRKTNYSEPTSPRGGEKRGFLQQPRDMVCLNFQDVLCTGDSCG